jgi:hypothetical protein
MRALTTTLPFLLVIYICLGDLAFSEERSQAPKAQEPKFDAVILVEGKGPDLSLLYVVLTQPKADNDKLNELVVGHANLAIRVVAQHKFEGAIKADEKPKHKGNVVFLVRNAIGDDWGCVTGFSVEQLREIVAAKPEAARKQVASHAWSLGKIPASPAELKTLVKNYALRNNPELKSDTRFAIEEYAIDGLKALDVQIVLARYLADDGSQFNEALLMFHDGKLTPFGSAFGGHGLMSAVVSGGKLYYTYSFGSGRHFCRLALLSIGGGKLTFAESGPLLQHDFFVKKDGVRLRLEKGEYEKFNAWKAGPKIGEIAAKESGFAVLDDAGKEIETLAGKTIEEKSTSILDLLLPGQLKKEDIDATRVKDGTFTKLEFAGSTFWLMSVNLGRGVPHTYIGIYAPDKDGVFHRSLSAESWAAGNIAATVDAKTGILELREQADSDIKGQLVLACNLKTIGTQHSIRAK